MIPMPLSRRRKSRRQHSRRMITRQPRTRHLLPGCLLPRKLIPGCRLHGNNSRKRGIFCMRVVRRSRSRRFRILTCCGSMSSICIGRKPLSGTSSMNPERQEKSVLSMGQSQPWQACSIGM